MIQSKSRLGLRNRAGMNKLKCFFLFRSFIYNEALFLLKSLMRNSAFLKTANKGKLTNFCSKSTCFRLLIASFLVCSLSACSTQYLTPQKGNPAIDQMNSTMQTSIANNKALNSVTQTTMPSSVANALLPDMNIEGPSKTTQANDGQHFNISVNQVDARQFFMGLVKGTKENMIVSP